MIVEFPSNHIDLKLESIIIIRRSYQPASSSTMGTDISRILLEVTRMTLPSLSPIIKTNHADSSFHEVSKLTLTTPHGGYIQETNNG